VDVFDAGPVMTSLKDRIRTYRKSLPVTVRVEEPEEARAATAILATDRLPDFRSAWARISLRRGEARIGEDVARALDLATGDKARVWVQE
jgi:arginine N-succinyltransferase